VASVVNPANAITASRYLTLPPFLYWVDQGHMQLAGVTIVLCAFADLFDGAVARRFHCTSPFGEMFDAATDGICYGFFAVCLVVYGMLPVAPMVGILVLGGLNSLFRFIYTRRIGRTTNYRSWAMERIVGVMAYLAGFGVSGFEPLYFTWATFLLMTVVMIHDTKRMLLDPVPE